MNNRYINGDEYHGDWVAGMRQGYGHMTETSQAGSRYSGNWSKDQYDGYGIYDDKVRYHTVPCRISRKIDSLDTTDIWACSKTTVTMVQALS